MTPRSRWIAVVVMACSAAIAVAFFAGMFVKSKNDEAIVNSQATPRVVVTVEERSFPVERPRLEGIVSTGQSFQVDVPGGDTTSVVTSAEVEPGDDVTSGTVLGRVSGRPVIALHLPFALYRDMSPGDQGDDVVAIQRALATLGAYDGPADGTYGREVEAAVSKLYTDRGLLPPRGEEGETLLRFREIFAMPAESAIVESISPVGTVLEGEPFARLRTGDTTVSIRIPSSLKDSFAQGNTVVIDAPDQSSPGTVTNVSEFRMADSDPTSGVPGFDAVISVDSSDAFIDGSTVPVYADVEGEEQVGPSVPITAIRQDGDRTYVVLDDTDNTRVDVEVTRTFQGWALMTSSDLSLGDRIVISSPS